MSDCSNALSLDVRNQPIHMKTQTSIGLREFGCEARCTNHWHYYQMELVVSDAAAIIGMVSQNNVR